MTQKGSYITILQLTGEDSKNPRDVLHSLSYYTNEGFSLTSSVVEGIIEKTQLSPLELNLLKTKFESGLKKVLKTHRPYEFKPVQYTKVIEYLTRKIK